LKLSNETSSLKAKFNFSSTHNVFISDTSAKSGVVISNDFELMVLSQEIVGIEEGISTKYLPQAGKPFSGLN
jgi:hypothetical protein